MREGENETTAAQKRGEQYRRLQRLESSLILSPSEGDAPPFAFFERDTDKFSGENDKPAQVAAFFLSPTRSALSSLSS